MSCNSPLLAYRDHEGRIVFLNRDKWTIYAAEKAFGARNILLLPCRKCSGCQLSKRREYAIRCAMESKYHDECSFITLTYDDAHNKGYLVKRDLQYFIKKLRNKGYKFRYFGCGEYGSSTNTHRPHYHLITFGYSPRDRKLFSQSATDHPIFISDEVQSIWNKGFITVQNFEPDVASYVAGYVNKKLDKDDGFLIMSKKPGLGYQYLYDHADKFIDYDFVSDDFGNLKKVPAPKYFDKVAKDLGLDMTYNLEKRAEIMSDFIETERLSLNCDKQGYFNKQKLINDKKLKKLERRNLK